LALGGRESVIGTREQEEGSRVQGVRIREEEITQFNLKRLKTASVPDSPPGPFGTIDAGGNRTPAGGVEG